MLNHLDTVLSGACRLQRDKALLAGVSGGADSLCMLDALRRSEYPLVVAHFNHHLRSQASQDAQKVADLAATWGLPFTLGEGDTVAYAQEHHLSIEEAARELRYRFLFEQADCYQAQAVAVAHTADDQVETVLMHLLRGAGLDGLTGMSFYALPNPWSVLIPLVRPLLSTWRDEIEVYCIEHELIPVIDESNADTTYFRNRLRHILIPQLETYIPGLRTRLWQTADLLAADRDVLDELTDTIWREMLQEKETGYVVFLIAPFRQQPLGVQRRLIRKAVAYLRPGARNLDFAMVQRVIRFSTEPTSTRRIDIGLGLDAFLEEGKLIIATWEADLPSVEWPQIKVEEILPIPGAVDLGNGWRLQAEIVGDFQSVKDILLANDNPFRAWIDLGKRQPHLNIRPRRPGDRFHPLGMAGQSQKLSDFMVNQKIPQRARAGWPLVCAGNEIIWVPGYRSDEAYRVTSQSAQSVLLVLTRD